MSRTDSDIQQAVLRELTWDTRVEGAGVSVEVDCGAVTLTGTVDSFAKRIAAQEAAHRVAGVLDVASHIAVHPPDAKGVSDADVAGAVRNALEWDVLVPHSRIRSTFSHGWVTLEGDVDYWSQYDDAERAVRNLRGIRGVSNRIQVKPPDSAEWDVRRSIEEALERHVERDAKCINVDVNDGMVTLTGTVHSWAEREVVIGAARGTPGVRGIDAQLTVAQHA